MAVCLLAVVLLPFMGETKVSATNWFDYEWQLPSYPHVTTLYVANQQASEYPYLKGKLIERSYIKERYYEWRVHHRNPADGNWSTSDRTDVNTVQQTSNEGGSETTCNNEKIFARKITTDYGTWYFETRKLTTARKGTVWFWFCPKKSYFDKMAFNKYYAAYLEAKGRRKVDHGWGSSGWQDFQTRGTIKVTVFRTANGKPNLVWSGNDSFLKSIEANGRQKYDDIFGFIQNNSKPTHTNVDTISAVQEKWSPQGVSDGGTVAEIGVPREEIGLDDWGGLERPLGENLSYGTWHFADNYQRFMFRPNSAAINTLVPGDRVRSHVTYSWVDPECFHCPNRVIRSDTARVEIRRPGSITAAWDPPTEFSGTTGTLTGGNALESCYNGTIRVTDSFTVDLADPAAAAAIETTKTKLSGVDDIVETHQGTGGDSLTGVNYCNVVAASDTGQTTGFGISEFKYGYWIRSNNTTTCDGSSDECLKVAFVPKSNEIDKLTAVESVESKLKVPIKIAIEGSATQHYEFSVTINGDPDGLPAVKFASDSYRVDEDGASVEVKALLTKNIEEDLTVNYTLGGTAVEDVDFTPPDPASITFVNTSDDSELEQTITIPILDNQTDDGQDIKTIILTLTEGASDSGYELSTPSTTTITIVDNEATPTIKFAEDSLAVSVGESSGEVELNVMLSREIETTVEVRYELAGSTATIDEDFMDPADAAGKFEIATGSVNGAITIDILADTIVDKAETFTVTLQEGTEFDVKNGKGTATVTIVDDDSFSMSSGCTHSATNNSLSLNFGGNLPDIYHAAGNATNLRISPNSSNFSGIIEMSVASADVYGQTIEDPFIGTLTPLGENIVIPKLPLTKIDFRGFYRGTLEESSSSNPAATYSVGEPCEFNTWIVDSTKPGVALDITEDSVIQNDAFTVRVTAIPAPSANISVPISIDAGQDIQFEVNGNAVTFPYDLEILSGKDYGEAQFTFASAEKISSREISAKIGNSKANYEPNATYWLDYSESVRSDAVKLIGIPTVEIFTSDQGESEVVVHEEDGSATLRLELSHIYSLDVAVPYSVTPATARPGFDFLIPQQTIVTIPSGQTFAEFDITILQDQTPETTPEQFSVVLESGSLTNATLGANTSATVIILDNSEMEIWAPSKIKEGESVNISIYASAPPSVSVILKLQTLIQGNFYLFRPPKQVEFPAGQKEVAFEIQTKMDESSSNGGVLTLEIANSEDISEFTFIRTSVDITVENEDQLPNETKYSVVSHVIEQILLGANNDQRGTSGFDNGKNTPEIFISSVSSTVEEGSAIDLKVSAVPAPASDLTVWVDLQDPDNRINGSLFRNVSLRTNQSEVKLSLETKDNNIADDDSEVTVSIRKSSNYLTSAPGSIKIAVTDSVDRNQRNRQFSDMNRAVAPNLLALASSDSLGVAENRVSRFALDNHSNLLEIGGQSSIKGWLQSGGQVANEDTVSWQKMFGNSAVNIDLMPDSVGLKAAAWSYGENKVLTDIGDTNSHSWDGDLFVGSFGLDAEISQNVVVGLSTSIMDASVDYQDSRKFNAEYSVLQSGFHPYVGIYNEEEGTRLQAIAGYGQGLITIDQEEYASEYMNSHYFSTALSGSQRLALINWTANIPAELNLTGSAWMANQFVESNTYYLDGLQTMVGQFQFALETSYQHNMLQYGSMTPSFSLGTRFDRRDHESELAMEAKGGVEYRYLNDLDFAGTGLIHLDDSGIRKRNFSSRISYDQNQDQLGTQLEIVSTWRILQEESSSDFWGFDLDLNSESLDYYQGIEQTKGTVGYGLTVFDGQGTLIPNLEFILNDGKQFDVSAGMRLSVNPILDLNQFSSLGINFDFSGTKDSRLRANFEW